uniref:Daunorubicin resistance ABC transporter ATPase subunit (ABC-2.AB.A) n=1 Tax=uncultured marine thaumarchaeote KM3_79_H02 TaxID=1456297 RepID=A0A075HR63_9ARCH|nr:daunorubicin resistance ABC transporter ATPase subunit (ABC-2.AB.A) [uncultured marine thaumarchaeote KM3_79_H02]
MHAIEVNSLTKKFGNFRAVDNISVQVEEGEIFGFLGPNGAGKSTTMMILTTLLKPTSGNVFVGGYDVMLNAKKVREKIGYVQQEISVDEFLTGRENLYLHARINQIPSDLIKSRIDDVLELVELGEKKDQATLTYSGGMRKRLDIANGLLSRPSVLFLDEPTVGLDIQTRRKIWGYIKKIREDFGMTIFISTHYMEEADKLCDRIGIIDHGKIQVVDTPKSMKSAIGNEIISFNLVNGKANQDALIEQINKIEFVKEVKIKQDLITVFSTKSNEVIPKIFQESINLEMRIRSLTLKQPTLDDVFISYTGHDLRDENENQKFSRRKEFNLNRRRGL